MFGLQVGSRGLCSQGYETTFDWAQLSYFNANAKVPSKIGNVRHKAYGEALRRDLKEARTHPKSSESCLVGIIARLGGEEVIVENVQHAYQRSGQNKGHADRRKRPYSLHIPVL